VVNARVTPVDRFEWWKRRIDTLSGFKEEAARLYGKTGLAYEPGPWAILKLSVLAYYVDVYTAIIKKNFPRAYYLDVFAGPGLNRISETKDVIFGSPLIADRIPKDNKKFDKLVLVEKNRSYAEALQHLLPGAAVIQADVNATGLTEALAQIPSNDPFLAFIDPEGFEIAWTSLQPLLLRWSDVIVNFQLSQIPRTAGAAAKTPGYSQTLTRFFGTSDWQSCRDENDYLTLYAAQIQKYKDKVIPIKVKGAHGYYYYVIVAVKKTRGAQGWVDAIEKAKHEIESVTYRDAKHFLRIFKGEQKTLFGLF
jgi:three-Cys-motif partner protein